MYSFILEIFLSSYLKYDTSICLLTQGDPLKSEVCQKTNSFNDLFNEE